MIFSVLSGKMIFIFPETIILFFRRKMKDDLSQTKYMKIWFFLQMFWKDDLSKKRSYWNMVFLVLLSRKMIFLFPENIVLFFRRKMKDDLPEKNTWKYDIFFKFLKKMICPKKSHWNMIFLVLSGKIVFLYQKIYRFLGQKIKDDYSQEKNGNMIFYVYMHKCYKMILPFWIKSMKIFS